MIKSIVRSCVFGMFFCVLTAFTAFASENISVSDRTVTYTIDVTGQGGGNSLFLYFTTNGASVDARGSVASGYAPRSTHYSGKSYDISRAFPISGIYNNPTYTKKTGEKMTTEAFADSISISMSLKNGRLTATVSVVNPSGELSGLCFVKMNTSGKDVYYTRIGSGNVDISEYVREAVSGKSEEEPAGDEPSGETGDSGGKTGGGEDEENEENNHDEEIGNIRKKINLAGKRIREISDSILPCKRLKKGLFCFIIGT